MLLIQTPLVVLNLEQDGVRLPKQAEQLWEANNCKTINGSETTQDCLSVFCLCMLLSVAKPTPGHMQGHAAV